MAITTVDPRCRICRQPLTDWTSRARRVGPDCWARLTPAQQAKALELAAAERDPFHVPAPRRPSAVARVNNANARAAVQAEAVQLCRHENRAGACPDCRREADPTRAAERILREVLAMSHEERRAERVRVLTARYAHVPQWTAPPRTPRPSRSRRTKPPQPAPEPAGEQLELA